MSDSVYKRVELIGTSSTSWEDAVDKIVERASESVDDIRVCEVDKLDTRIENNEVVEYRARAKLSFKTKKRERQQE